MPKKELSGSELVGYIQQRQASVVRSMDRPPILVIIVEEATPVTKQYLVYKQRYAQEIGADVRIQQVTTDSILSVIAELNADNEVDGILVQLPLSKPDMTDEVVNSIVSSKDVDGLSRRSNYDASTPTAILWLLSGHNIDITVKRVAVVGQGRLVGAPLIAMLRTMGIEPMIIDVDTAEREELLKTADIIVTATGDPGSLRSQEVGPDTVVIDAGTATDGGRVVGDAEEALRARQDIRITPVFGGVGPLTIAALFENLIRASNVSQS